jgi:hypothetical protein
MTNRTRRLLFWSPRVLGVLFAAFVSLFALDVLGFGLSLGDTIRAFLIHLVPTYIVVIVLVIAWRREWIGAALFAALAILYVAWGWGLFHWSAYALISGPLLLLAILFLLGWIYRAQIRPR